MINGLLLLNKPSGLSSNQALQRVRRVFAGVKAGHTGTLDPFATGMLPICLGEATKVAGYLSSSDKAYEFTLGLGARTDTGDCDGEVVEHQSVPELDDDQIERVLKGFRGSIMQTPPMYSAKKIGGERLYRLAREGKHVAREPQQIVIHQLALIERGKDTLRCTLCCSKGTYVRVLCEDIARALGTVGRCDALRRQWVSPFEGQPMVSLGDLEKHAAPADLLLAADTALQGMEAVHLSAPEFESFRHGRAVDAEGDPAIVRVYRPGGTWIGIGERGNGRLVPRRLLRDIGFETYNQPHG